MGRAAELPILPPIWAPNYFDQAIHRIIPILIAFDEISQEWQQMNHSWLSGNDLDEGEPEPKLPDEFGKVREMLNKLFE